ncbi:MAG TPA: TraR/DksA C4-type zinc finger protein [Longimicrobiaceae bacterium]|nr:TraR/DksA C4-type zinc finger protein [Longimicrobiaceae bacterium]
MPNDEERDQIEARLLRDREDAVEALRRFFDDAADDLQQQAGELGVYRFHLADVGSEAMEREKQFLLASNEGRRLYEIDEALRRLYRDPDTFGICEECGREIAIERLLLVPSATRCADCQAALEAANR